MRLEAQKKGGYYPAPPGAIAEALSFLQWSAPSPILDPCAGKGLALKQLAEAIGTPPKLTHGIELEESRAEELSANLPGCNLLAPASFFSCRCTARSFGFAWVNPPYDDEIGGGGRVEHAFLVSVAPWIKDHGVLAFVVPEKSVSPNSPSAYYLRERFANVAMMEFPQHCRKYGECIVFGIKRPHLNDEKPERFPPPLPYVRPGYKYTIPPGDPVRRWEKYEPTPNELAEMLARSPLRKHFEPAKPRPLPRPLLPISSGHTAMMLGAGQLDGLVCPPGEPPHVVRGTVRKERYLKEHTEDVNDQGEVTVKTVIGEKMCLTVRTVDGKGEFKTLVQE